MNQDLLALERIALGAESVQDTTTDYQKSRQRVIDTIPEVIAKYLFLRDKDFLDTFPDIVHLTSYFYCQPWYGNVKISREILLADNIDEWLYLLHQMNEISVTRYILYRKAYAVKNFEL